MRLWHIDFIDVLPKSQLMGQWRELNSIYAKEDKHILINFIYEYDKKDLLGYSMKVIARLLEMNVKINLDKFNNYFQEFTTKEIMVVNTESVFINHMNFEYLEICYFNLKEKYIRGQKDFKDIAFCCIENIYKYKRRKEDEK